MMGFIAQNNTSILYLEGFSFQENMVIPVFLFFFTIYFTIVVGNVSVMRVIIVNRHLHEPMYILLCNMSLCDLIGSTALLPRLMVDLFAEVKSISFELCFTQAFCIHFYGTASKLILIVMAYDRYVAICNPLRYTAILTGTTLVKLCCFMWGVALILIVITLGLTVRLPRCGTTILLIFCNNVSLFSLSCVDTTLNSIFGLATTYFLSTFSFTTIVWTYGKILYTCLIKRDNNSKRKAIHTCATHLTVYIFYEVIVLFTVIAQRYPSTNTNIRNSIGILIMITSPLLNPIIYGINTKEIRRNVFRFEPLKILDNNQ
ncbi:olfactory receptor 142-like [Erpetoichthys calabaricus]|uniref:olfactory receptor 142-like n=1 Tax=Erpetoichthys calabaricus TaxID=27687 RepID=UPI002234E5C5|nr:olfactory receptor 142-like [Erpetoichthys calabaricus]